VSSLNLLAGLLLTAVSTQLLAGGLYLNEFGTPAMGTAGAGAHALPNDASTAFHNTGRHEPGGGRRAYGFWRAVVLRHEV
jgi:long-subunit fatty acid transport protein